MTRENITSDLSEAIGKLLSPSEELAKNKRWQSSSLALFASGRILEHLIKTGKKMIAKNLYYKLEAHTLNNVNLRKEMQPYF